MRLGVVIYLACGLVFAAASVRWYPWVAGRAGRVVGGVAQGTVWPPGNHRLGLCGPPGPEGQDQ